MEGQDPRELYAIIAENLKALRASYNNGEGIYQKELAKQLGISQQTYAAYETGTNRINLEMLSKIAVFFGVSLNSIITNPNEERLVLTTETYTKEELKEIQNYVHYVELKRKGSF